VDGTALNLEQVHGMLGKRFERSEECAGTVGETHGKRNFARFGEALQRLRFPEAGGRNA